MQPTDKLTVELEAQQWNAVLQIMDEAPMPGRIVRPLIASIQQQCMPKQNEPIPMRIAGAAAE